MRKVSAAVMRGARAETSRPPPGSTDLSPRGSCFGVGAYFGVARIGAATDGITLCGVEHKRDGVIGREVANIALLMFAEKSCASATKSFSSDQGGAAQ